MTQVQKIIVKALTHAKQKRLEIDAFGLRHAKRGIGIKIQRHRFQQIRPNRERLWLSVWNFFPVRLDRYIDKCGSSSDAHHIKGGSVTSVKPNLAPNVDDGSRTNW